MIPSLSIILIQGQTLDLSAAQAWRWKCESRAQVLKDKWPSESWIALSPFSSHTFILSLHTHMQSCCTSHSPGKNRRVSPLLLDIFQGWLVSTGGDECRRLSTRGPSGSHWASAEICEKLCPFLPKAMSVCREFQFSSIFLATRELCYSNRHITHIVKLLGKYKQIIF